MLYKFQYDNASDRAVIINENQDKYLIEEQNLFDGNYLIFSDASLPIENTVDILLLKQEGIL